MSAFGQAGFGSRNRRNQLRSQGQMDPYGQQVRAAKQAPTFNIYQTQGTQQATGQQQAPSQSQPAPQPAAAQPSLQLGAPAMPAYSQPAAPIAGSAQGSHGTAQPIQPQSQGTPYGQGPSTARPPALRTMSGMTGTIASEIAAQYHNAGLPVPQWLAQGVGAIKHKSLKSMYDARYVDPAMWKNASESERIQFLGKRGVDGKLLAGPDGNPIVDAWSPEKLAEMAQPTYGPGEDEQVRRNLASYHTPEALAARDRVGAAQPIQPQSQGTPYGADPGYAARVAAAGRPPGRDASGMSMDVVRASQDLEQRLRQNDDYVRQLRATDGVVLGPNQRWMQPALQPNAPQQVYEIAGVGVGPDGKTMQPIYQPAKGKLQLRSQSTPGQAQPIQPQSQGTPYQPPAAQASLEDRYRAIGMDPQVVQAQRNAGNTNQEMAQRLEALESQYADGADARDRWALEASRRGVDPLAGAPLANRSAEQAAYHSAAYAPPDTSLPPQDEGILAYLRQRDAPKPTAQPSQQLYRTAMNSGVPDQQLAFEQDAFRNMAQRAVDREAFHGANDPYVQQFLNRMQYQGFDPRQGLSVSQHIQDAQAMRQRHAAIRANPTAYQRGEI